MTHTINITAVDNELIILAYHWTGSYELCRVLSGNDMTVSVTLTLSQGEYLGPIVLNGVNSQISTSLNVYLPVIPTTDSYSLLFVGIDWGGAINFAATVDGTSISAPMGTGAGVVWRPAPIPIAF